MLRGASDLAVTPSWDALTSSTGGRILVIVLVVVAIAIAVGVWVILDAYGDAIWDLIVILFWGALVLSAFVGLVSWVMGGS